MKDNFFDIAVIGAGAAGCMAAIRACDKNANLILIERNSSIGKKIYLTGDEGVTKIAITFNESPNPPYTEMRLTKMTYMLKQS
ncbi:MAG: NAD(P)/FAD-dependent oxidoreductase [Candidatus Omnitrophica bacterium]|nr:NAD(P)/FAD-dependent oxidoreductase [Candidatus Omnitrophota bacterium]